MNLVMNSLADSYRMVFRDLSPFLPVKINRHTGVSGYFVAFGIKEQGVD